VPIAYNRHMNNDRDYEGATQPFDAHLARAKAGDAEWNQRHPDCYMCGVACCLARGSGDRCGCEPVEGGVMRGRDAVHAGQCLVVWTRARAVETVAALMDDVAAGLRVLRERDHLPLPEQLVLERARNIVAAIVGSYDVQQIERSPVDFADGRIR